MLWRLDRLTTDHIGVAVAKLLPTGRYTSYGLSEFHEAYDRR